MAAAMLRPLINAEDNKIGRSELDSTALRFPNIHNQQIRPTPAYNSGASTLWLANFRGPTWHMHKMCGAERWSYPTAP